MKTSAPKPANASLGEVVNREERRNRSTDGLCIDCGVEPPMGRLMNHYYKRCPLCCARYDAKRHANRDAKLRRQAEMIRNAGKPRSTQ